MSLPRTWSRRGVLMAIKQSLLDGLGDELDAQLAANQADAELLEALPALGAVPDPGDPKSIRIAAQGQFKAQLSELPTVRIVGLTNPQVQAMGMDPAALAGWPIGIFVHARYDDPADSDRDLSKEELIVLLLETWLDAIRLTLHAPQVGIYDRYGIYGMEFLGQRVAFANFDTNHTARELLGEQLWLIQQTVRT